MSHRLELLIPEDLDARIRKAAKRSRISKAEWVRRAIGAMLEKSSRETQEHPNPLARMESLEGPTGDIDQMLAEIDVGRTT